MNLCPSAPRSMNHEIPYCWGNADPSQVRTVAPRLPHFPDLTARFVKSIDPSDVRQYYRVPVLRSKQEARTIHKDCPRWLPINCRGSYWWDVEQINLEDKIQRGRLIPVVGAFYCFLEEGWIDPRNEVGAFVIRHGNIFGYDDNLGYHWVMKTVVFPKDHPDADVPPYQMVDVTEDRHIYKI